MMVSLSKWLTGKCDELLILCRVKTFRPLTPSTRYIAYADFSDITKSKPEKSWFETSHAVAGVISMARQARGIGGGHKQKNPPRGL